MSNSNRFNIKSLLPFHEFSLWKQTGVTKKNRSHSCKQKHEVSNKSVVEYKNSNTINESTHELLESSALKLLEKLSSTELIPLSPIVTNDKVTYNIRENAKLGSSRDSISSNDKEPSCYNNISYFNALIPQQQFSHVFTSFNNAAQSTKNKRASLLRGFFQRHSLKQNTSIVNYSIKKFSSDNKQRCISGGDQVKISHKKSIHSEKICQAKDPYVTNIEKDIHINHGDTNNKIQYSSQGLCYEFKDLKSTTTITPSETRQISQDPSISIPFANSSSFIKETSLSCLSDPTTIQQNTTEQKEAIKSAHTIEGIPKIKISNTKFEKTSFNANQHKFYSQMPAYQYPKRLSTIKTLAKQYSLPVATRNSTGLFWYNANEKKINRMIYDLKNNHTTKKNIKSDASIHSQDTSSSTCSSSTSQSSETKTDSTSSNSTSSSTSTILNSQSDQLTMKTMEQYNRNQNDQKEFIRIDLNSISGRTSTNSSLQSYHQRQPNSRRQYLSSTSSNMTTSDNNTSTSTS